MKQRSKSFSVHIDIYPATSKFCCRRFKNGSITYCRFYDSDILDQMHACGHCAIFGMPLYEGNHQFQFQSVSDPKRLSDCIKAEKKSLKRKGI